MAHTKSTAGGVTYCLRHFTSQRVNSLSIYSVILFQHIRDGARVASLTAHLYEYLSSADTKVAVFYPNYFMKT